MRRLSKGRPGRTRLVFTEAHTPRWPGQRLVYCKSVSRPRRLPRCVPWRVCVGVGSAPAPGSTCVCTATGVPALARTQRCTPLGLGASSGWGSDSVGHCPPGRKREGTGTERDGALGPLFTTTTTNLALGIEKSRVRASFRYSRTQEPE